MHLDVLGCNGTYPTRGRPASGYLVTSDSTTVMMDIGPGTFMELAKKGGHEALSAVIVTHIHPDHCTDLFALHHALTYTDGPGRTIPVYCPEGFADAARAFTPSVEKSLVFKTVRSGSSVVVGGLDMRFGAMDHPPPSLGVRVDDGAKVLVYSGDTGPGGDIADLAADADVLLVDATFQGSGADKPAPHHLTAQEAAALATSAGVQRLLLTHVHPALDPRASLEEARAVFSNTDLAEPGMEVQI